jgi:hypothetical protein
MRLTSVILGLGLLVSGSISSSLAAPSLSFFSGRSAFETANPGLPTENFEEGRIAGLQGDAVSGPLSSTSQNNVFSAGEILPGVSFSSSPSGAGLFLAKPGYGNLPSKALSVFDVEDSMEIHFGQGALAVGLDLFALNLASPFELNIYGAEGLLGTASVNARADGVPSFFGVSSSSAITRLSIDSLGGPLEFVDNVSFSPVPEPSVISFVALSGLLGLMWRRKQ